MTQIPEIPFSESLLQEKPDAPSEETLQEKQEPAKEGEFLLNG